jgi:flagellar M-ring protein FliF
MPGERSSFVNQVREMWARLLWPQRLTIIGFGLLGLAFIGSLVYFMNRVGYEPLYRDLNPEDAKAIADKLTEQKKEFIVKEAENGFSILVAGQPDDVNKLKLDIAGSGLARSGKPGLEIFDKNQFGMTDFTEQVNLQRALEGELARTISSLSEIFEARVHIVLPKDSVFSENKEDAKASVKLKLKPNAELSKSSVAGIKGLLAGAVPGLHTYNVSIVGDDGRLLSQAVESGDGARSEMESGQREQLQKEYANNVISILEPVVGKGKVHANASIDLDFNTTEQTEETYNPNSPIVMSQQKSEERSGNSSVPSGIPGTQSNMNPPAAQSGGFIPEHTRQSEVTNYEVSKSYRHTVQPKGSMIRKLSVAVILDNKTVDSKTKDGKVTTTAEPRSQEELNKYRDLVMATVGYNQQRGDVVTIENVPFYKEHKLEEPQAAVPLYIKWQGYIVPGMKYVSFIVLFTLAYILFVRPIRKRVFQSMAFAAIGAGESSEAQLPGESASKALPEGKRPEELAAAEGAGSIGSLPAAESRTHEEMLSLEASDEQIERELMKEANMVDLGSRKYAAMKKKLVEKAKSDPELVSQLLRSLLREKA